MNFWLLKTEPNDYSWEDLKKDVTTQWTGVRNFEARNNMKKISLNDLCFFYHTGSEKSILGLAIVIKEYYKDPKDPKFGIIEIAFFKESEKPLSLKDIKVNKDLQNIILLKRSRLSVIPITKVEASHIIKLLGISY